MSLELIVEGTMCVLLLVCIGYGMILSRHLKRVRDHQAEFQILFDTFSQAIARAQQGIQDLKKSSEEAGAQLAKKIEIAQKLVGELEFLVGRAESITAALEKNARAAKDVILQQTRDTSERVHVVKPSKRILDDDDVAAPYGEVRPSRKGSFAESDEGFDLLKSIEKLR